MNEDLKKYYRNIRRCLPCDNKLKRQIMDSIKTQVNSYLEENLSVDFTSVQQHFGTPQQIAAAYIDEMTSSEILKKIKVKKAFITITCAAVAVIVFIWLAAVSTALTNAFIQSDGYYDVGTVIEE